MKVEFEASPAYELILELGVVSVPDEYDRYEVGGAWLSERRGQVPPHLIGAIEQLASGSDKVFPHLILLAHAALPPRDIPSLITHVEGLEAMDIYLTLLGYPMRHFRRATPADVIRRAANGDREARKQFQRTSYPDDAGWQDALHNLLALGPDEAKRLVIEVLQGWYHHVLGGDEAQIAAILDRDVEEKRVLLQDESPERVIEMATGGIEYAPEPGITRVVLIPSLAIRPWTHALDSGETKIFCYPVATESITANPDLPPLRLVRLTKALGDERRLQVLRMLAGGRATLSEIAGRFDVSRTTMHHHLTILRTAGLIRMRSSDRTYSLRPEVLPEVSDLLETYLQGGT